MHESIPPHQRYEAVQTVVRAWMMRPLSLSVEARLDLLDDLVAAAESLIEYLKEIKAVQERAKR